MRVGIIGTPTSRKSEFAEAISNSNSVIIDDYVKVIQETTDLALGAWATYSEEFMIAGQRYYSERKSGYDEADTLITVGTLVDTLAYCAIKSDAEPNSSDPDVRHAIYTRIQGIMGGLSLMIAESWDYDLAFYLPLEIQSDTPVWIQLLDKAILTVLESYPLEVYALGGSFEQRITTAKELLSARKQSISQAAGSSE